jgi:tetratricopeptide (TPR) repeat protein
MAYMNPRLIFILFLTLLAVMGSRDVSAQQKDARVALVIGNAAYPDAEAPLKDPVNSARAFAEELRRDGFEVDVGENLTKEAMRSAIDRFYGKIKSESAALFFFSGFGIQSARQTYIVPVNGQIWTESDVRRDGFSLDSLLAEMNARGARVKIAILNASRRNPFERRFRTVSEGLAPATAPKGTVVMYAAAPGMVVRDGDRELFVSELLKEIRVPGKVEEAFNRTLASVSRASQGEQVPWFSSTLVDEFSFAPSAAPSAAPTARPQSGPQTSAVEPEKKPPAPPAKPSETAVAPAAPAVPATPVKPMARLDNPTIKELDRTIERNANDAGAFYRRGQLFAKNGDFLRAIKDFDEAIRLDPKDAEALNNRCWARAIIGEFQPALRDCNEALQIRPRYVDAFDSRGFVNLKIGQNYNAITDYDAALRINPKQASSLYGRGIAKLRSGNTDAGNGDVAAAKAIQADIAEEFAGYGVR